MAAGRFCFLHSLNRKCASKITLLCFVVQMADEIKTQYLDKLPLANASESFLDDLTDAQMDVGNLIECTCSCSSFKHFTEKSHTEAFKSCDNI